MFHMFVSKKMFICPLEFGRPGQKVLLYVYGSSFLKNNNYKLNYIIWTLRIHILLKVAERNIPEPMSSRRRNFTVIKMRHLSPNCYLFETTLSKSYCPENKTAGWGSPVAAQWVKNLTSIHEDAGFIPGLAEWIGVPALSQAAVLVTDAARLGFGRCCGCGIGHCSSDSTPSLETSICRRCSPKKAKSKEKDNGLRPR